MRSRKWRQGEGLRSLRLFSTAVPFVPRSRPRRGDLCLDMVAAATFVHRPRVAAKGSSLRRTKPKKVTVATMVMPARMTD